jgi:DNA-binding response OmpR family regulator
MAARVLIVEDNDATLTGLSELLKRAGYSTYATRSFEEGARVMREDAPDLLIADIRLGPFNGLQLLVTSPTRVPTIIMTGYPDPVLEADAVHLGAQFILKPVAPAVLLAMIESQLAKAPAQAEPTNRRFPRKQLSRELIARVESAAAQVLDVSYGGMRLSLASPMAHPPQSSFDVHLPGANLRLHVNLVWSNQTSDGGWLCGAALSNPDQGAARAWHGLVDAIV